MDNVLEDEILSINAIYSESTFLPISQNPTICALSLPGDHAITLRLEFPNTYPDAPPSILGTQSVGQNVGKGEGAQVVEISRLVLAEVYQPGAPCIFDLLEETNTRLQHFFDHLGQKSRDQEEQVAEGNGQHNTSLDLSPEDATDPDEMQSSHLLDREPPWITSDVFTEKKSVFVARAAFVSSPAEAKSYLQHLLATDKKVAKATHNITAWRIHGANDATYQDCDDDGEAAAGGRVLHLMQLMDLWDVMVVITRWYGGVQLGPDRFRLINSAARDAFVKGGFVKEPSKDGKQDGGKKKSKK